MAARCLWKKNVDYSSFPFSQIFYQLLWTVIWKNSKDFTPSFRESLKCNISMAMCERRVYFNIEFRIEGRFTWPNWSKLRFLFSQRKIATKYFIARIMLRAIQFAIVQRCVWYKMRNYFNGAPWIKPGLANFIIGNCVLNTRKKRQRQCTCCNFQLQCYVFCWKWCGPLSLHCKTHSLKIWF